MKKTIKIVKFAVVITVILSATACVKNIKQVGYTFNQDALQGIKAGKTRKAVVKRELGSPSAKSSYGADTWYYISTEYEHIAFLDPKVSDQKVVAIEFDSNQTVRTINIYGYEDAQNIDITPDQTQVEGHDMGVLGQILGNVGRFNKDGVRRGP